MSIIVNRLPDSVMIGRREYKINTDFRIGLKAEMLIKDDSVSDAEKLPPLLRLYYPKTPDDTAGAVSGIIWFYSGGRSSGGRKESPGRDEPDGGELFCFERDAEYIFAAFYQQYGIDLNGAELHWWKFRALFRGLTGTKLNEAVYMRGIDTSGMPPEAREYYNGLKKLCALPMDEHERREVDAVMGKLKS